MAAQDWTPGPWMVGRYNQFTERATSAEEEPGFAWPLYCTDGAGRWIALFKTPEDARRASACVNACEGWTTEDLESFAKDATAPNIQNMIAAHTDRIREQDAIVKAAGGKEP